MPTTSPAPLPQFSTRQSLAARPRPTVDEMYRAFLARDPSYEGIYVVGVRTTGVFCRNTCSARKPNRENIEFYRAPSEALAAGFRPCRRCRPLAPAGDPPPWLDGLLAAIDADPQKRWTDRDLADHQVQPARVRRWFKANHGITFQAYSRMRRLGAALHQIQAGDSTTRAALASGYDSLSGFGEAIKQYLGSPPSTAAAGRAPILLARISTPLGPLLAGATEQGLCLLEFADRRMLPLQLRRVTRSLDRRLLFGDHEILQATRRQLDEYFRGRRREFDVPLQAPGTPFQQLVWDQLRQIPYGSTLSYDALARAIGRPGAPRAVGRANGDNRLAIVIPCHRIVRRDGTLGGYGGGKWRKQALLDLEQGNLEAVHRT